MVDLIRGPMVWLSMVVFIGGTVYQVVRFFLLSKRIPSQHPVAFREEAHGVISPSFIRCPFFFLRTVRHSILVVHPVTIVISSIFHVCLVTIPLFLLGHNELIELAWGISLPSFSEKTTDGLTVVVLLCVAYFLIRRMVLARVRSISSLSDFLVLGLAAMPFLTGFLAYHQIFDYRSVMLLHMLCGELMLMAIPFTKLTHMIFFFLNRFLVINEHTLGAGRRVWS